MSFIKKILGIESLEWKIESLNYKINDLIVEAKQNNCIHEGCIVFINEKDENIDDYVKKCLRCNKILDRYKSREILDKENAKYLRVMADKLEK